MPMTPPGLTLMLALLAPALPLRAQPAEPPMRVLEVSPVARSTMDGNRQEFLVRFDGPVDQAGSVLTLHRDGAEVRRLQPRRGASPNILFAIAGGLSPGAYTLRWEAKSGRDGTMTEGSLEFTVR